MLDRSEKHPQTKIHVKGLFKAPVAISYDKTIYSDAPDISLNQCL